MSYQYIVGEMPTEKGVDAPHAPPTKIPAPKISYISTTYSSRLRLIHWLAQGQLWSKFG